MHYNVFIFFEKSIEFFPWELKWFKTDIGSASLKEVLRIIEIPVLIKKY